MMSSQVWGHGNRIATCEGVNLSGHLTLHETKSFLYTFGPPTHTKHTHTHHTHTTHAHTIHAHTTHAHTPHTGNEQAILSTLGLADETHLFVWDGLEVGGKPIQTGKAHEPLLLHFTYSIDQDEREMDLCVARSLTLGELRVAAHESHVTVTCVYYRHTPSTPTPFPIHHSNIAPPPPPPPTSPPLMPTQEHLAGVMDTHVHQVTVSQVKLAGKGVWGVGGWVRLGGG